MCADPDAIREIMLLAYDRGFINGEYVFLNIDLFSRYVILSDDEPMLLIAS